MIQHTVLRIKDISVLEGERISTELPLAFLENNLATTGLTVQSFKGYRPMRYVALVAFMMITPVSADMRLSIGGLSGWSLKADVVATKGEPVEKETFLASLYTDAYHYPGLTLYFTDEYLVSIVADNADNCTAQDICPGDNIDKAISVYGTPDIKRYDASPLDQYSFYDVMHHGCWYTAEVERQRIKEMAMSCH